MTYREVLDKRAAALKLKVPAKTTDAQLEKMIAAAEAELTSLADGLAKSKAELETKVTELEATLADLQATSKDAQAEHTAVEEKLRAEIAELQAVRTVTTEVREGDVECIVTSGIVHDGEPYVIGDRIQVTPAQFAELSAAGAVEGVAKAPAD
ncbi:hypothetical protein HKX23_17540 [Sulfitobacter sp. KE29]|uniref:DUF7210 family protein n=1 Tax=unclassified Sulfitobacter TaxID=196795 RepID=UPI0023E1F483|nr:MULTISPECIES: hypothetical protein [unclassified Sulfitobacter]MDF3420155.1 hypothetical protein [Sulfitobacter sp. Ks38]MDF3427640.1 hypothetical protein [Sulfitobacter sp. KE29]MDF3431219.1 hypothetical protein [Sulfitobacter sp. S46]MDF3445992.1 hypothetical protein [Sulfitobacter sp. KE31]MDF3550001.1 hypothetical protein [Sulfitobacter sp. KE28]